MTEGVDSEARFTGGANGTIRIGDEQPVEGVFKPAKGKSVEPL